MCNCTVRYTCTYVRTYVYVRLHTHCTAMRRFGTTVLRHYGTTALRYYGTTALRRQRLKSCSRIVEKITLDPRAGDGGCSTPLPRTAARTGRTLAIDSTLLSLSTSSGFSSTTGTSQGGSSGSSNASSSTSTTTTSSTSSGSRSGIGGGSTSLSPPYRHPVPNQIFDVVRGMAVCPTMTAVAAVVSRFARTTAVTCVRAKDRFLGAPSAGGWRDFLLCFFLNGDDNRHICEIQVRVSVQACMRACVRACWRVCLRTYVCAGPCACVRHAGPFVLGCVPAVLLCRRGACVRACRLASGRQ
jgi:hypothetical protein